MTTWCKGLALVAVCLTLAGTAHAQPLLPSQIGAARMPAEPAAIAPSSCCNKPTPPLTSGPISPLDAPPGPSDCLSLPANHSGAFQAENYSLEQAVFLSVGTQGLERQKLGFLPTAFLAPSNLDVNTPFNPRTSSTVAQRAGDIDPDMGFGIKGTLGYLYNNHIIEFTGYYIYPNSSFVNSDNQGRLNLPFRNPPVGFEGNNGLFLNDDRVRTTLQTQLYNLELNYRYSDVALTDCEVIMGVRYLDQRDRLNVFVGDDVLSNVDVNTNPDPRREATYTSLAKNRLIAPQLGFEYHRQVFHWLSFGTNFKGAWGLNILEIERDLVRGDNFVGFQQVKTEPTFSHLYDLGFFLEFQPMERAKVRFTYTALWLLQIGTAERQVDYNLANPGGSKIDRNGSIFYQGPSIELMFLF